MQSGSHRCIVRHRMTMDTIFQIIRILSRCSEQWKIWNSYLRRQRNAESELWWILCWIILQMNIDGFWRQRKAKTIRIMVIMCGVTEKKVFTQMIWILCLEDRHGSGFQNWDSIIFISFQWNSQIWTGRIRKWEESSMIWFSGGWKKEQVDFVWM